MQVMGGKPGPAGVRFAPGSDRFQLRWRPFYAGAGGLYKHGGAGTPTASDTAVLEIGSRMRGAGDSAAGVVACQKRLFGIDENYSWVFSG